MPGLVVLQCSAELLRACRLGAVSTSHPTCCARGLARTGSSPVGQWVRMEEHHHLGKFGGSSENLPGLLLDLKLPQSICLDLGFDSALHCFIPGGLG